jgi:Fe-S cluster assembly protein SufD
VLAVSPQRKTESYLESFALFEDSAAGHDQEWLRSIRRSAIARFSELGFPTTRDEDWRFTNVAPIAETSFRLTRDGRGGLASRDLDPFVFSGLACRRLVFVNDRYVPQLSSLEDLPKKLRITGLAQALASDGHLLEPHLARYADYQHDAFSALNTAFTADGAYVHIPRGTVLEQPVHLLYVSTSAPAPTMTHPRNLVLLGDGCEASVVEEYVSLGGVVYFSNAVTEAVVGENSILHHYLIERESHRAFNVSTLRVEQGRNSSVESHSVLLGGALVRNNIHVVMSGEGGDCLINGLFMGKGSQHLDNYMKVEHASPHCNSRQFYHGVLDDKSRGVFHGRIVVHKGAQKTDAKQTNRNLLLSEEAQMDTKPQLEIYADDVKCTHGATIGQIDEDALFYLRSRGIADASARRLLLYAFANESLQRMKIGQIREHLETLVKQWAPEDPRGEEAG